MNILERIDALFDENKPKEAESLMLDFYEAAKADGRAEDELLILNELIGYYRQTSEKPQLLNIISNTENLLEKLNIADSISFATSKLNIANAYRSIGELDFALKSYIDVESIYAQKISQGEMDANDLRVAGLLNNMSLLFQELGEFTRAEKYQLKALDISNFAQAGFEIAVSHANLATTYFGLEQYDKASNYASRAMELFDKRGVRDPHYAAAVTTLANCQMKAGEYESACSLFKEAMSIVESTIGRNSQYARIEDNLQACLSEMANLNHKGNTEDTMDKMMISGLELSKLYYEEYGKKMIHEKFPEYEKKIAVGLVGEGSDCFGFDDEYSGDHDYGPSFCMWVTDETYEQIGEALNEEYEKLPSAFMGVERLSSDLFKARRGVIKISDFYKCHLGTDDYTQIDFMKVPEYEFAVCSNGEVFTDEEGVFSFIYNRLCVYGYPINVRYLKIAEDVAAFSQNGQYNYKRMMDRKDTLTATMLLGNFCKACMKLYLHISGKFVPHDKWIAKSVEHGDLELNLVNTLQSIIALGGIPDQVDYVVEKIDEIADIFVSILYQDGYVSDIDNYLDHHIDELMVKAGIVGLSKKELVDKIARLEFEAFDKVSNEGGRASCQNDWPTFSVMRKSQYLTWSMEMLTQYYYDFNREYKLGHNLITEKYGRMMESTAPERYEEIKDNFPELSEEKKAVIEGIVRIQMQMVEAFASEHPKIAGNARDLHTYEDGFFNTSYETYLRGEISTYSDKMLQLYGGFVVGMAQKGENIAFLTIENTAKLYGYKDIYAMENV